MRAELLIRNAVVVTCAGQGLGVIRDGAVACAAGKVIWVGASNDASDDANIIEDARGQLLMPGLIDPHTHLVFAGRRSDEFARKMAGEDYRSIAASGGGIMSTVRATRAASTQDLFIAASARVMAMMLHGVTRVEVKSGYGLSFEDELRCLEVVWRLLEFVGVAVSPTCLAAHVVPTEYADRRGEYVQMITERLLPEAARRGLATRCDVYVEPSAFSLDEARVIWSAAKSLGLSISGHIGQFTDVGAAEVLAELGGQSADHLEEVSDAGLAALARAGVVGVLLPGAWNTLRQRPPDVGRMRAAGLTLAVGTDCNPGTSPCTDLLLCAALAVRNAGLSVEEALLGITRHAAKALGLDAGSEGTIAVGARANFALFGTDQPSALVYGLGDTVASRVWMGGLERPSEAERTASFAW